ncbi:MAG: 3'(2'),5'-bisphosphate nucleotidase CysQ [Gammaproteobacteria bacterium]|nr:3'(2'),5'-bisphosphate nucleotidase CysQ [Gammaproteobacteria bacterium]
MIEFNPREQLGAVCDIARDAGRAILDVYERAFTVEEKEDRSPITAADRAANEIICQKLEALTPGVPVMTEESARVAHEKRKDWKRFWLVDPLDGTKEFISRNGEFTVNIALIDGNRPVLGVVYVPVTGLTYYAATGKGAFKQRGECEVQPIHARRFEGGKPIVVASRSHAGPETEAFLKNLGEHDVVSMGSALKFCLVAEGTADVYPRLGPTMEWDTAAAQCVVEVAGGRVTDLNRQPMTFNKPSLLNPSFLVCGAGDYDWYRHLPTL